MTRRTSDIPKCCVNTLLASERIYIVSVFFLRVYTFGDWTFCPVSIGNSVNEGFLYTKDRRRPSKAFWGYCENFKI